MGDDVFLRLKSCLDILIPAALFHDAVTYPKDDHRSSCAQEESARVVSTLLFCMGDFPQRKISDVVLAITSCSFTKNVKPDTLEGKILQDADGLEATGAIAVMRTFTSGGSMGRALYHPEDPFCQQRQPDDMQYSLDLFYTRLLKIIDRMYTPTGRRIALERTAFLKTFLEQAKNEISE